MADLQSMTLQERMVTIINAEHSLSYGINDLSFQEACNKWLIETGSVNGVDYSGISINKYTPEEAFAIIRHKINLRSETLNELVSELGSYYPIHKYTATEALNKRNAVLVPYSLSFDGVNDYVNCGSGSTIDDVFDNGGSISGWIYPSSDGESSHGRIADKTNWLINLMGESGGNTKLRLLQRTDTTDGHWDSPVQISNGAWTHLVVVYDNSSTSNDPIIYLNGTSVTVTEAQTPNDTRTSDASASLYIGNDSGTSYTFDGKIDEVALFNKELTQAEVTSLYAADPQNAGDAVGITNLVGYWKFDEGSGEPQDTSGNGNHGTITSATWTVH